MTEVLAIRSLFEEELKKHNLQIEDMGDLPFILSAATTLIPGSSSHILDALVLANKLKYCEIQVLFCIETMVPAANKKLFLQEFIQCHKEKEFITLLRSIKQGYQTTFSPSPLFYQLLKQKSLRNGELNSAGLDYYIFQIYADFAATLYEIKENYHFITSKEVDQIIQFYTTSVKDLAIKQASTLCFFTTTGYKVIIKKQFEIIKQMNSKNASEKIKEYYQLEEKYQQHASLKTLPACILLVATAFLSICFAGFALNGIALPFTLVASGLFLFAYLLMANEINKECSKAILETKALIELNHFKMDFFSKISQIYHQKTSESIAAKDTLIYRTN